MANKSSLTLIEFLVIICIILILIGTFAIYAEFTLKTAREMALTNELFNLRMSIEHYRVLKGKPPEDLITLVEQEFNFSSPDGIILEKNFLKPFRVDKQRYLLDPFMHRYVYDKVEGRVRSETKGYEGW